MTNVFKFPENKIVREVPINVEEIERAKEKSLQKHAESIVEDLMLSLIDAIENYGIDVDTENFDKDISFVVDGLRASIYRSFSIDHPLHSFIDTNVKVIKAENYDDLKQKMKEMLDEETEVDIEE